MPTVPFGKVPVAMASGAGLIVRVIVPVVVVGGDLESVPLMVRVAVPAVVGVPVMVQPEPSARPAGSVPAVMLQV